MTRWSFCKHKRAPSHARLISRGQLVVCRVDARDARDRVRVRLRGRPQGPQAKSLGSTSAALRGFPQERKTQAPSRVSNNVRARVATWRV